MNKNNECYFYNVLKEIVLSKQFIVLFFIYLLSVLTIIRANYDYIDDLGRIIFGYCQWLNFSRYITEFFAPIINGDYILNDISPLPQILACLFLAASSAIMLKAFSLNKETSLFSIIAVLPLGISPYFLECLSFKFDAPFMAFSIFISILPILFVKQLNYLKYFVLVFICTIAMCMSYQASSGLYIMSLMFYLVCDWNRGEAARSCIEKFVVGFASFSSSVILYKLLFVSETKGYVSTSIASYSHLLEKVLLNVKTYFALMSTDNILLWKALFVIICIMYLRSFTESSKKDKVFSFFVGLITIPIGMVSSLGCYIFLEKLSFFPRTMYGIGVFLAIIALISVNHLPKNLMAKIASCAMSWVLFSFAFCYGNALAEQNHYDEFRTQLVIDDLYRNKDLLNNNSHRRIQLQGSTGYSPIVKRMVLRYGILGRLVPLKLNSDMDFGRIYPFYFFGLPNIDDDLSWENGYKVIDATNMPIVVDTCYHTIKADDKSIVVIVKKREGIFGDIEVAKGLG